MTTIRNGATFGRVAGRITAIVLALYVVSLVYRSSEELAAIALGGVVALYAVTSIARDVRYGHYPWEPVEWTTVPPNDLNESEYRRALRWTIVLKLLAVIGAVSALVVVFATGLQTLGYVMLVGGLPALTISLYKHYANETKPWYPSVPSCPFQVEADRSTD